MRCRRAGSQTVWCNVEGGEIDANIVSWFILSQIELQDVSIVTGYEDIVAIDEFEAFCFKGLCSSAESPVSFGIASLSCPIIDNADISICGYGNDSFLATRIEFGLVNVSPMVRFESMLQGKGCLWIGARSEFVY